jgi:hypothetical protein
MPSIHRHRPRRPARPDLLPTAQALEPRLLLATFTVTNTGVDAGSLRQAITDANANPGADVIRFNIPGTQAPATTIRSTLPAITGPLDIDGTSQPGYTTGKPVIYYLGGGSTTTSDGLVFNNAGNCRVRGLIVSNWGGAGIRVGGTTSIVVESNWIGLDPSGTLPVANGFGISTTASGGRIGGTTTSQRNVISGNRTGIELIGNDNVVTGNGIGITGMGNGAVGNGTGVRVRGSRNRIGGTTQSERNHIAGNTVGVRVGEYVAWTSSVSVANVISGNYVGTNDNAVLAYPNGRGIWVSTGADGTIVGGTTAGAGNLISGNTSEGVDISPMPGSFDGPPGIMAPINTRIEGNIIGLSPNGQPFGNGTGIYVWAGSTVIGGTVPGARNVISVNTTGIIARSEARIEGNYIGLNLTGTTARPNGVGMVLHGSGSVVGGRVAGAGNVISGNTGAGIRVDGGAPPLSPGHLIEGNRIGTNAAGTAAIANAVGVEIVTSGRAVIGGDVDAARNVISGNGVGVRIETTSGGASIRRNFIGTNATGIGPIPNTSHGVFGASENIIAAAIDSNVIAYNGGDGIRWMGGESNNFLSNSIHTNAGLGIDLGGDGVTPNDARDADTGPNGRQNFPVITSALSDATQTDVRGSLDSLISTRFRIQFFSSPTADASGHGEGATYLGEVAVITDSRGAATFTAALPQVPVGHVVTATASRAPANTPPETSEFSAAVPVGVRDVAGPRVAAVFVQNRFWRAAFVNHLKALGIGSSNDGYAVPAGPAQLAPLPWGGMDVIRIRFNEPVVVEQDDLAIKGAIGDGLSLPGDYSVQGFHYDPATYIATWWMTAPLRADRLRLELNADGPTGVADARGNALDGEWADGVTAAWPSGDGAPGGDFVFRFNVLPGDADQNGVVNSIDLARVRRAYGTSTPFASYSIFADLDGDGRSSGTDVLIARANQRRRLPPSAGSV